MGDLREPNGVVVEDLQLPSQSPSPSSSSSWSCPDPFGVRAEKWAQAELVTQEIIWRVQPTVASEERRREVIDYVQRLLRTRLGYEVFPFGSVPLKTFLPDGDIDLTVFGDFNVEEVLAEKVYTELEAEERNSDAECIVKDVQYIGAEVKLVKCLVQNIVVDISFNQIGGLCTLCFLEQVDRCIGKNHLFKRSIILIKAWCYYESRILGAHHGLISTYALETLVLYIFHLYHSSLYGPLAVLYKFLEFYRKFDWESFCVSLNGPVHVSSLPQIVAERPDNGGGSLLLSSDFLKECVEMFSVPSKGNEMSSRIFLPKHLNIVDPLKESNNLGRSVSRGNFFRIRSAFTFGARKLAQILLQPEENIAEEVRNFFANTLDRHGRGQRPDVHDTAVIPFSDGLACDMSQDVADPESEPVNSGGVSDEHGAISQEKQEPDGASNIHESEKNLHRTNDKQQRSLKKQDPSIMLSEAVRDKDADICDSGSRFSGDAKDLTATAIHGTTKDMHESSPSSEKQGKSPLCNIPHVPHYFSHPPRNGKMANGHSDEKQHSDNSSGDGKSSLGLARSHDENTGLVSWRSINEDSVGCLDSNSGSAATTSDACYLEGSEFNCWEHSSGRMTAGNYETLRLLSDLTGDYDNDLKGLRYGRWWFDYASSISMYPVYRFQRENPWDTLHHSVYYSQIMYDHVNANAVIPRPPFFPVNPLIVPGAAAFRVEELPKARGTGLYFPITNHQSYRERSSSAKALKSPRNNGQAAMPLDKNPCVRSSHETGQAQSSIRQGSAKPRSLDFQDTGSPTGKIHKDGSGFIPTAEFRSFRHLPPESPRLESSQRLNSDSSTRQTGKPQFLKNNDRLGSQSYRLKEEDFPPLSV